MYNPSRKSQRSSHSGMSVKKNQFERVCCAMSLNAGQSPRPQDAFERQQVMSPNGQAPLLNGSGESNLREQPSGSRHGPPGQRDERLPLEADSAAAEAEIREQLGALSDGALLPEPAQQGQGSALPIPFSEATAVRQQVEQSRTSTTGETGRRPWMEPTAPGPRQADDQGGYLTPRSTVSSAGPPVWLSALELPRWMTRFSAYLSAPGRDPGAPSPLAGTTVPHQGGQAFTLRSPVRQRRAVRPPSPPSSSSIPAEAIQAEVQRQMSGLLARLQESEARNQELRAQLEAARAETAAAGSFERAQGELRGDGGNGLPGPGNLWGLNISGVHGERQGEPAGLSHPVSGGCNEHLGELPELRHSPTGLPGSAVPQPPELPRGDLREDEHRYNVPQPPELPRGDLRPEGQYPDLQHPLPQQRAEAANPAQVVDTPGTQGGLLRTLLGRPRTPSPPPARSPESPMMETIAKGMQQLQQLQAQAMAKSSATVGPDTLKAGTTSLSPLPDLRGGAEASLKFQDWLEIAETSMSDVSEQSGRWWRAMMKLVEAAYARWLAATPIERLAIQPEGTKDLCEGQWLRMNARASSMLLNVMSEELKADMLAQRVSGDTGRIVFRLYTWFQPGGSAERQEVLRRLQAPAEFLTAEGPDEVLKALRSWPRWLARCTSMGMTAPDPTVMARGLMNLTTKTISLSPDATFRTAMLRTSLRLDGQPSMDQVCAYQRHLQAEIEGLVAAILPTAVAQPRVQALESTSPKAEREKCKYVHSLQSLDREARSKKCLRCGSEAHRAKECPVVKGAQRGVGGQAIPGAPRDHRPGRHGPPRDPEVATLSTAATLGSTLGSTTASTTSTAEGVPWTLEALVQAAHQVVQSQNQQGQGGDSSPEKTKAEVKMMIIRDIRVEAMGASTALLDSGATHCLRSAKDQEEWESSVEVLVQLAGSSKLFMRMNDAGSLLMPPTTSTTSGLGGGQTIVPVGVLVSTLGYRLDWGPHHCNLIDKEGEVTRLKVQGGCPQLCELEALAMISRIEDRRRENLENMTQETMDSVNVAAVYLERSWHDYLKEFIQTGNTDAGLRSLRDAPFLQGLPGTSLGGLLEADVKKEGWKVMKGVDFLSRPQRRRLWSAKRWIVHLYAGNPGHYQVFQADENDTVVLELDVDRCRGHDITRRTTWRLLQLGAVLGKIDAIVGGPPGRGGVLQDGEVPKDSDLRVVSLMARMMWLYAMAEAARTSKSAGPNCNRPVAFMIEHPAESPQGVATGKSRTLWTTAMWQSFENYYELSKVTFDQRAMGATASSPTTIGTNIYYLMGLQGLGQELEEKGEEMSTQHGTGEWSPGFVDAVVTALKFWTRMPRETPRMMAFTPEQWKAHVRSNHADYRRDCITCVMSRGTGKRHARVRYPDQFCLTIDLAGPIKPGLDSTSKGTIGKGLRYMVVAKFTLPKEFVKSYSGKEPPKDEGMGAVGRERARPDQDDRELPEPSLLPSPEGQCSQSLVPAGPNQDDGELPEPSLLPSPEGQCSQLLVPAGPDQDDGELPEPSLLPSPEDPFLDLVVEPEGGPHEADQDTDPVVIEPEAVGRGHPEFLGASRRQRQDYEDSMYAPSEPDEDSGPDHRTPDEQGGGPGGAVIQDCEAPESTSLLFARALKDNGTMAVKAVIQDIVLYLQSHGLPVYRLHADKGETFSHNIRQWLRDQGIRATWSEPGVPQGNGRAESTVRWVKDQARTLMMSARVPTKLWPTAIEAATAIQRSRVLGWKSSLLAPYGATVVVKQKVFDSSGPRRRERAMETRWMKG